jgi:hypothetical protein
MGKKIQDDPAEHHQPKPVVVQEGPEAIGGLPVTDQILLI